MAPFPLPARRYMRRHWSGSRLPVRAYERGRFVGDVMTTCMLALSLEDTSRDSLRIQRVQSLATVGLRACAEVDAFAATLGFAESSENGVVNAWSNVGKLTSPFPTSSSSSSSTTTTISYSGFFAHGLIFMPSGLDQLTSNGFCSTCINSFEPDLHVLFHLPNARRSLCAWPLLKRPIVRIACARLEGWYKDVRHELCGLRLTLVRTGPRGWQWGIRRWSDGNDVE